MPTIKETISQVLSPTNATYINGVSVRRDFAKAVLEAVYQGLVEKDGKGINGKFVTEQEANDAGQIFVNRLKAHHSKGREHGAAKNGGAFNNEGYMSATETVGIEVLTYFDEPIIVPRASQDRINLDLVAGEIANYVNSINTALNGSSWAAKWIAQYNTVADKRNDVVVSSTDISNKDVALRFIEANEKLDAGDEEHDIDYFDLDTRIATFKTGFRSILTAAGVLNIGGANYGYDILRNGTVDAQSSKRNLDTGFWGVVDNVEVHGLSNLSLRYAAWFCGLPTDEFIKGNKLYGWVSSSLGNARGFSTVEQIKTIDAHGGQGLEIQPLTKIGAITWYPKTNVAVVSDGDYDPIADLKALFVGQTIAFKLKAGGSRYYAEGSVSAASTTAFTCSATAKDDSAVDHLVGAYYYVGEKAVATVGEFLSGVASATEKGSFTLDSSKSFGSTQTATDYVNCLVIADDGTCTIFSKVL